MSEILKWNNGDVYTWSYKNVENMFEPYHCRSCIGIVRGLSLEDTFWGDSDYKNTFSQSDCFKLLDLVYLGNINDYIPCAGYERSWYDDKDLLDLSHSNCKDQFYRKKDAVKSKEKMLKVLKRMALQQRKEYQYALSNYDRLMNQIKSEKDLEYIMPSRDICVDDESYEDSEFDSLEV